MSFRRACRLLSATENQDNEEIKRLIADGNLYQAVDASNNTLMHHAAIAGNHDIVQYLVDLGSKVDAENDLGQTPLIVSLQSDFLSKQVIEILLKAGASTITRDTFHSNALEKVDSWTWLGEDINKFEIYKIFLENAQDFYEFDLLNTDTEKVIKMCMQTNFDLSTADSEGKTFIHLLASCDNLDMRALLRGKTFDVNVSDIDGWTPLMYAVINNAFKAAEFLLGEGSDIEAKNGEGRTVLYIVFDGTYNTRELREWVQFALEHGANVQIEITAYDLQLTILDLISQYERFEAGEMVLAQLVLQEAKGIVITPTIRSKINLHDRFKTHFEKCKQYLPMKIYRSITLFDILTASERKFERYLRNKELISKLENFQSVQYFNNIIYKRLSRASSKMNLAMMVAPFIGEIINIDYDCYPFACEEIVSYLSKEDLKCLIAIKNDSS